MRIFVALLDEWHVGNGQKRTEYYSIEICVWHEGQTIHYAPVLFRCNSVVIGVVVSAVGANASHDIIDGASKATTPKAMEAT
mmetsp:Transcript_34925/g.75411  ORF Transcript_34925/g.75411 Transcript_34925/m.75411 type:complete len:82 (+) Transcript_34925:372-617(+)